MIRTRIVKKGDVADWVSDLHQSHPCIALGMLLAGDRWSCIEEVVVAKVDGKIVGIATIAPRGEQLSGKPTLVSIFVLHDYRSQGVGHALLEAAIDYMASKELMPIKLDILNSKVLKMIQRLPAEKRDWLSIADQTMGGLFDCMLDA